MANNNYDRMLRGEPQQPPVSISNKAKQKRQAKRRKSRRITLIALCVLGILLGVMTLGATGAEVQSFLLGIYGWFGVLYCLMAVVFGALSLARVPRRALTKAQKWLVIGGAVLLFIVILFVHLLTSLPAYEGAQRADGNVTYGAYLSYVFEHGAETAGGALISLVAYPFINSVGLRLSEILLSVLFFLLVFAMIYPFWITTKERRIIAEDEPSVAPEAPRLFVETVEEETPRRSATPSRTQSFDFSFPNANEADTEEETDAMDTVDFNDPTYQALLGDHPTAHRDSAVEWLLGLQREGRVPTGTEDTHDPGADADNPLQFGERQSTRSDWARPMPEAPLSEEERRRQSFDRLFGTPVESHRFTSTPVNPTPPEGGLAEGTTETILPRSTPRADASAAPRPDTSGLYFGAAPSESTCPEEESYYTPRTPSAPTHAEPRTPRVEPTPSTNNATFFTPPAKPDAQSAHPQEESAPKPVPPTPRRPAPEPPTFVGGASREPVRPARPAASPQEPSVAPRADASLRPVTPADADTMRPVEYPPIAPSSLDAALDAMDDYDYEEDYMEEEEPAAPVDQTGFVSREEDYVAPTFGGFVERSLPPQEEEVEEEEAQAAPAPAATPEPGKPRTPAVPNAATRQAARAFAPKPKAAPRPYSAPPLYLLKDYMPPEDTENHEAMYENLEEAFRSYGIAVKVLGHTRGPTYTQYAVQLADGVSYKRVTSFEQDIVRKMRLSEEINIVPKVPNRDAIGVEVVNKTRSRVGLKPLLTSPKFRQDKKLYFVLGVDVMGQPYYCDILSGPHMLIAGSSGSGKSVCLNTLICSILFNYKPDYVKFILIDPKGGVEMDVYNDLPHNLLGKCAVTPQSTIKALDWAIEEMERRYALMRDYNVRSLGDYNDKLMANNLPRLPYVLVIIDELADLMKLNKKMATDLEQRIARLTAKARASGIHVIVATQRPSVDVITGTIKNNIPTRVAFKTATQIDSKTILEKGCAEKLYGKGDMYFMSSEFNELKRLQGPFLTDDEVSEICDYIRAHNDCEWDETITARIFKEDAEPAPEDDFGLTPENVSAGTVGADSLFEKAVRQVAASGTVSISRLQRDFRIGFTRAGYLVDEMEKRGFIEPALIGSSRPRRVLITLADCDEIFGHGDTDDDGAY